MTSAARTTIPTTRSPRHRLPTHRPPTHAGEMLLEEFLKPPEPRKWRPRRAWAFRFSA